MPAEFLQEWLEARRLKFDNNLFHISWIAAYGAGMTGLCLLPGPVSTGATLVYSSFTAKPPVHGCRVNMIILPKYSTEIPLLRRDENQVASNDGRQKKDEHPGKVEGKPRSRPGKLYAQVREGLEIDEDPARSRPRAWAARDRSADHVGKLPPRKNDKGAPTSIEARRMASKTALTNARIEETVTQLPSRP